MEKKKRFEQEAIARANQWQAACGINGQKTAQQLQSYGGVEVIKRQIKQGKVCEAFDALAQKNMLDLSLEALVVDRRFDDLFEDEEVNFCLNLLLEAGYTF